MYCNMAWCLTLYHNPIYCWALSIYNYFNLIPMTLYYSQTLLSYTLKHVRSNVAYDTYSILKTSFSFHKLIPQNTQMTTIFTNLSLYITSTMIYYYIRQVLFCKVSHHYLTSGRYQVCL